MAPLWPASTPSWVTSVWADQSALPPVVHTRFGASNASASTRTSPACVTAHGRPPIVSVQLREVPALGLMLRVTCPLPVPFIGDTVIQPSHGLFTAQSQVDKLVTVTFT